MKILYIAFGCSPGTGSEDAVGWRWPILMRKHHDIYVLTREKFRPAINKYISENKIENVHFFYADIPFWGHYNTRTNRFGQLYWRFWQLPGYAAAKKIVKKYKIDIVHHVTSSEFRVIGFMNFLPARYYIGPLGGGQVTPEGLKYYARNNRFEERGREWLNKIVRANPYYQYAINKAERIFATNYETADFLQPIIKNPEKLSILFDISADDGYLDITKREVPEKAQSQKLVFLWGGRMVFRKGLEFLFDALKQVENRNNARLILCGSGKQFNYLQSYAEEKGLRGLIEFRGKLSYEEMQRAYAEADCYIFPSIRESAGAALVEAMANYLPVVAVDGFGQKLLISDTEGWLINGKNRAEYIDALAGVLTYCIAHPDEVRSKGIAARKKIEHDSWKAKIDYMNKVYRQIK